MVFDAPGKTFRDELFAEYKAHRPPMPDDLRSQIEPLFEAVRGMGLPILRETGVEADDVIGTLACAAAKENLSVLISTGDKDMAQLVSPQITLINTMSGTVLDRDGVKTKFDVFPEQIIDYLALVGDSSDNIPGIDKVGPKTAAKWLGKYSTLDALVADAANVEGKVGENLRAGLATLELARKLATIRTDVTLPVTLEELKRKRAGCRRVAHAVLAPRAAFAAQAARWVRRAGRPAPTRRMRRPRPVSRPSWARRPRSASAMARRSLPRAPRLYETITTEAQLDEWLDRSSKAPSSSPSTPRPPASSTCTRRSSASRSPFRRASPPIYRCATTMPARPTSSIATPASRSSSRCSSRRNTPRSATTSSTTRTCSPITASGSRGMRYDSMLESYVWNSVAIRHDMDSAAERYLGIRTIHYEDVAGKGAKQISFSQVPVDKAAEYSSEDSDVTLRLHQVLWPQISSVPALKTLYEECEQPLVPVLLRMEEHGVLLDRQMLRTQSTELGKRLMEMLGEAHKRSRRAIQSRFAQAARQHPVREDAAAGDPQDADRAAVDRGRRARGARRRATRCPS